MTIPLRQWSTKSNAAHCEHPGERPDERKQIKITRADSQDTWASELSKEAVGNLLHTVPWTNSLTKSNAAHCEHPGERPDERKQIKITRADSQDTWASELSKEAVGANKVLCWSPVAFVRCQLLRD